MKRYACAGNREQLSIPMCLDDMIAPDAEVRAIDAIVEAMDIQPMGFIYSETKETGRKPYNPVDMFKLYSYSYFKLIILTPMPIPTREKQPTCYRLSMKGYIIREPKATSAIHIMLMC